MIKTIVSMPLGEDNGYDVGLPYFYYDSHLPSV